MSDQASQDLVTVTIDGIEIQAPRNAMIIEVADQAGINIPRFCYHKHLSIAANCRMCMVEVEKAPKPLPACATPINDGMQIYTNSSLAIDAQKGTMEFLLINHPLDCPVCDQGGECELQDIAMGYGSDVSRFTERKRVVKDKNIGPLVSTDMTRCIHCTRCVRFGSEVAGIRELGATGRGEFMEIGTYVEKSLASELSGNVIDLCPVGALNAKPSRMRGRAWEMIEANSISPHDAVGSNLNLHVIRNQVIRVVPKENPQINETWLSDRDRFSYEGMYSDARLRHVMCKNNGNWSKSDWTDAFTAIAERLRKYDPQDIGILVSPNQSNEELYLLQKIANGLQIKNIDHRVQQIDFSDQENDPLFPWLGQNICDIEEQQAFLVIGSDLRSEQPMLTHRIRKAAMRGAKVMVINPLMFDFYMRVVEHKLIKPQDWLASMKDLLAAVKNVSNGKLPKELKNIDEQRDIDTQFNDIAQILNSTEKTTVLIGSLAQQHFDYSGLRATAYWIAKLTNSAFGYIPLASNAAGASLLGVVPHRNVMAESISEPGMNYAQMIQSPRKMYLLVGLDPELDFALPAATVRALEQAECVVSLTSYSGQSMRACSDWMLPISCFAETEGTKVNMEGRWQAYSKVVNEDREVKDGWKVLRMLATELNLDGFNYYSLNDVQAEISEQFDDSFAFTNELSVIPDLEKQMNSEDQLYRIGSLPIYSIDSLVRHAPSLQKAQEQGDAELMMHESDIKKYKLLEGGWVRVTQDGEKSILKCVKNNEIMPGTVHIPPGLSRSEKLGAIFGSVELKNLSV